MMTDERRAFINAGKDRLDEGFFNQVEDSLPRVGLGIVLPVVCSQEVCLGFPLGLRIACETYFYPYPAAIDEQYQNGTTKILGKTLNPILTTAGTEIAEPRSSPARRIVKTGVPTPAEWDEFIYGMLKPKAANRQLQRNPPEVTDSHAASPSTCAWGNER